ncbi:hypothetical protein KO498_06805 [Lentibacter algarum]|uniref:hypothetical protein n=1 Tax=Lentibacter algarum TaxID=576131 RepID=UPI001C071443|nr:hypothetical protein [Lentibacter algarum]MBU2981522.1 hypothetical protein [Lentibacter algarum]
MSFMQAYFIAFIGGPLLMLLLTQRATTQTSLVLGGAIIAALVAAAVFSRGATGPESVGMLWLAWVGTVALCVRVGMRRSDTKRTVAFIKALGAMATVIPWLGLATADWMTG